MYIAIAIGNGIISLNCFSSRFENKINRRRWCFIKTAQHIMLIIIPQQINQRCIYLLHLYSCCIQFCRLTFVFLLHNYQDRKEEHHRQQKYVWSVSRRCNFVFTTLVISRPIFQELLLHDLLLILTLIPSSL